MGRPNGDCRRSLPKTNRTRFGFVPYRGGAPIVQDLVAGQIDLTMIDPTTSLAQVRAGNVKAFAVAAAARLSSAPEIPTVDEADHQGGRHQGAVNLFYISRVWLRVKIDRSIKSSR
jgi:tripartite-type tricarboxylate transporter receptor subunit TctC